MSGKECKKENDFSDHSSSDCTHVTKLEKKDDDDDEDENPFICMISCIFDFGMIFRPATCLPYDPIHTSLMNVKTGFEWARNLPFLVFVSPVSCFSVYVSVCPAVVCMCLRLILKWQ